MVVAVEFRSQHSRFIYLVWVDNLYKQPLRFSLENARITAFDASSCGLSHGGKSQPVTKKQSEVRNGEKERGYMSRMADCAPTELVACFITAVGVDTFAL